MEMMTLFTEVSQHERPDTIRSPPEPGDGVFVHGLVLEGAVWSSNDRSLVECSLRPRRLRSMLPVLHVTALPAGEARRASMRAGPFEPYNCPLYRFPTRGMSSLICTVQLTTRDVRPEHWVLRGVVLLVDAPDE